jgi:hypothetical protein
LIKQAIVSKTPFSRYAYIAPFYKQAKSVAWDYLKRYSRPIPGIKINESDLRIDYPNGARISLYGSDKADALRGLGFDGIVVDEFDDWRPGAWEYVIIPTLADRDGWAIVIGTVKGRNSLYKRWNDSNNNWDKWMIRSSESGILSEDTISLMKSEMDEDAFRQEMECDWDAAVRGAVYGREIYAIRNAGRIQKDVYDPALKVHVAMDIGWSDYTVLVFFQCAKEMRIIDFYATNHEDVDHYNMVMKNKGYEYGPWLWLPHDAKAKSMQTKKSVEEQFMAHGWKTRIVPQLSLQDGIYASRKTMQTLYFDEKCNDMIDALSLYQYEYDDNLRKFKDSPRHDWTSHYADALRYACLVYKQEHEPKPKEETPVRQELTWSNMMKRQHDKYKQID